MPGPIAATRSDRQRAGVEPGRREARRRTRDAVGRREHEPLVPVELGDARSRAARSRWRAARPPRRRAPRAARRSSLACSRARVTTTERPNSGRVSNHARSSAATSPTTIALGARHSGVGDGGERGPHGALVGTGAVAHRGDRRVGRAAAVDQAPGDVADAARAHEDHERAAGAGERVPVDVGAVLGGSSWPVTTVKWVDTPAVGHRDARVGGAPIALVIPGTTSNGTPAAASASASSPPRPNTNGSPPFSRTTHSAVRPRSTSTALICVLGEVDLARGLARGDQLGAGGRELEQRGRRQAVVHDDVGRAEQLGAADGEEPGVARARADEVDGHRGVVARGRAASVRRGRGARRRRASAAATGLASRAVARSTTWPSAAASSASTTTSSPSTRGERAAREVAAAAELARGTRARRRPPRARARRRSRRGARASRCRRSRHSTASAPCATWGSITDGSRSSVASAVASRGGRARRPRPRSRRSRRRGRAGSGCCRAARRT